MPNAKLKNYLHLHVLVFIAGFSAILGELISINAIALVWYRMLMAFVLIVLYLKVAKINIKISPKAMLRLAIAGVIIALHWITFFGAIKVSNISITLSMFSTGAFFASLIEPLIYKRKIIGYEICFGIIVIIGVSIIMQTEMAQIDGIILAIVSAFLSALFSVLNGSFIKHHTATVISFYEFLSGVLFVTLYILCFGQGFSASFFKISMADFSYLFLLAAVCTAYAFIASIYVLRYISPYTLVLTYNLEPVYGIMLAVWLFPEKEQMSSSFYLGATIILSSVLLNGLIKNRRSFKPHIKQR